MASDISFLDALGVLQSWMGEYVDVIIEPAGGPTQGVASMHGPLGAGSTIATPADEEEFEFTVGEGARFTLHRSFAVVEKRSSSFLTIIHEGDVLIHISAPALDD